MNTIKKSVWICFIFIAMLSCNEHKINKEDISLILQPQGRVEFYDTISSKDIMSINYKENTICISDRKIREVDSIIELLVGVWANLQIVYKGEIKYKAAIIMAGQAQGYPSNAVIFAKNTASGLSIFKDNCIEFYFDPESVYKSRNHNLGSLKEVFEWMSKGSDR